MVCLWVSNSTIFVPGSTVLSILFPINSTDLAITTFNREYCLQVILSEAGSTPEVCHSSAVVLTLMGFP